MFNFSIISKFDLNFCTLKSTKIHSIDQIFTGLISLSPNLNDAWTWCVLVKSKTITMHIRHLVYYEHINHQTFARYSFTERVYFWCYVRTHVSSSSLVCIKLHLHINHVKSLSPLCHVFCHSIVSVYLFFTILHWCEFYVMK